MLARDFVVVCGAAGASAAEPRRQIRRALVALGAPCDELSLPALGLTLLGGPFTTLRGRGPDGAGAGHACLVGWPRHEGIADPEAAGRALLAAFLARGEACLEELEGPTAGVLVDEGRRSAVVFTDRLGLRKAFVARGATGPILASRAVPLAAACAAGPDLVGVVCCVLAGGTLGERTIFSGVSALPPGGLVRLEPGGGVARRWARVERRLGDRRAGPAELEHLRRSFNASVAAAAAHMPRVALDLTAGMDTRAILSAVCLGGVRPIALTSGRDESPLVEEVARAAGAWHHFTDQVAAKREPLSARVRELALLTDGECDALRYGGGMQSWRRVGALAPGGTLVGAVGDVLRAQYLRRVADLVRARRLDPVGLIASIEARPGAERLLEPTLAVRAGAIFRGELERLYEELGVRAGSTAALDGCYLLGRQRILHRVISAAERVKRGQLPFADWRFLGEALPLLSPENRSAPIHRYILSRNHPGLASLPTPRSPDCRPLPPRIEPLWPLLEEAFRLRSRLGKLARRLREPPEGGPGLGLGPARFRAGCFDPARVRTALERRSLYGEHLAGLGSVLAIEACFELLAQLPLAEPVPGCDSTAPRSGAVPE